MHGVMKRHQKHGAVSKVHLIVELRHRKSIVVLPRQSIDNPSTKCVCCGAGLSRRLEWTLRVRRPTWQPQACILTLYRAAWFVVQVPGAPKREKRGGKKAREGRGGAAAADSAQVHPGVKKLVAAAFAKVLGTDKPAAQDSTPAAAAGEDAAAAEGTDAAAATPAADDAAKQDAEETAGAEPAEPTAADDDTAKPTDTPAADAPDADAAAAAAEAPAAAAAEEEGEVPAATDGIEPAVRKLVSSALAKATAAANRAAAKAASALPYEHLPKSLPQKPADVASLLLRRLRQLDPKEEQFSKTQEKLLLLQVGWAALGCVWLGVGFGWGGVDWGVHLLVWLDVGWLTHKDCTDACISAEQSKGLT